MVAAVSIPGRVLGELEPVVRNANFRGADLFQSLEGFWVNWNL